MPRVNIYLSEELASGAKAAGLNLSAVTQDAVQRALDALSTDAWLAGLLRVKTSSVTHEQALDALDAARDDPATWHG